MIGSTLLTILAAPGCDVRFGSEADMCGAKSLVRFSPNSDRESEFPQAVESALPPKADMCGLYIPRSRC